MLQKWLPRIGVASLAGACLFIAIGIFTIQDRITLVVAHESEAGAVDPIGLLADDVATLRSDFREFGAALGTGLEEQARQWDSRSKFEQSALEDRLRALEVELRTLTRWLGSVALKEVSLDVDPPREFGQEFGAAEELAKLEVHNAEDGASRPAQFGAGMESPPPRETESAGFLSFRLPTGEFQFDAKQRFQIIGSLSRVGFDAKSTLHDFTGVTSKVSGEFTTALGNPGGGTTGKVSIEAGTLRTGVEGRDDEMFQHLHTDRAPEITFELTALEASEIDREKRTVEGTAVGTMTIAGTAKEMRFPVTLSVDEGRRVGVSGETRLEMSEYGVEPPSQLGMIKVEDEVKVWLELRARSIGTVSVADRGTP